MPPDYKNFSHEDHYRTQWYQATSTQRATITYKTKKENKHVVIWLNDYHDYFYQKATGDAIVKTADLFIVDQISQGFAISPSRENYKIDDEKTLMHMIDVCFQDFNLIQKYTQITLYGRGLGGLIATYYYKYGLYRNNIHKIRLHKPMFELPLKGYPRRCILWYVCGILAYLFPDINCQPDVGNPIACDDNINLDYKPNTIQRIRYATMAAIIRMIHEVR